MIPIGVFNELEVLRITSVGAFLGDDEGDEVLLPNKYLSDEVQVGSALHVFVYNDSEDRIVATTEEPFIGLYEFACLRVVSVTAVGAFVDWGLEKDLLVPFSNQQERMKVDGFYIVYMTIDEKTDRLVGSTKLNAHFEKELIALEEGEEVDLLVWEESDLGLKVIINDQYLGLIYKNEVFRNLELGDRTRGYVKSIRPDNKIDIRLDKPGIDKIEPNALKLKECLLKNNGYLALTDKSDPELVKSILGMSKKAFKQALGNLYKKRMVKLSEDGISLHKSDD